MHEHSFIDAVVRDIENKETVKGIVLEVGELAGIEAGHLGEHIKERFGWDVEVLEKGGEASCECGFVGRPKIIERLHDFVIFECSKCGEIPKALKGKNIKILSVIYK